MYGEGKRILFFEGGNLQEKDNLGALSTDGEDNIEMDLKETGLEMVVDLNSSISGRAGGGLLLAL